MAVSRSTTSLPPETFWKWKFAWKAMVSFPSILEGVIPDANIAGLSVSMTSTEVTEESDALAASRQPSSLKLRSLGPVFAISCFSILCNKQSMLAKTMWDKI